MARPFQLMDGFWRGLLQRRSPRATAAGFVKEALNVAFIGGVPVSRPGLVPFHGASFDGTIVGMGFHVRDDGFLELLVAAGANIQRCIEGGDPETLALTSLPVVSQTRTAPERVNFLRLSGGLPTTIIYDETNENIKYDGEVLTRLGVQLAPTPTAPPLGVQPGGTIPRGTRLLVQTLVTPHHEGGPSEIPLEVICSLVNGQYTIPSPVQGVDYDDPQVVEWRLYSTVAGGGTFRFIAQADISVAITVNLTDQLLGTKDPVEQLVNDPPPAPAVAMCEHRGQVAAVFTDDRNLVRFSDIDPDYMKPESWPEDNVQPVTHGDGDELTTLISMHEWLVAQKRHTTHAVVGESYEEYRVVPVLAAGSGKGVGIGNFAQGTALEAENMAIFASRDGIYKIDRFASPDGGLKADRLTGAIDDLYIAAKFSLGASVFFDRKHRVFFYLGHG